MHVSNAVEVAINRASSEENKPYSKFRVNAAVKI